MTPLSAQGSILPTAANAAWGFSFCRVPKRAGKCVLKMLSDFNIYHHHLFVCVGCVFVCCRRHVSECTHSTSILESVVFIYLHTPDLVGTTRWRDIYIDRSSSESRLSSSIHEVSIYGPYRRRHRRWISDGRRIHVCHLIFSRRLDSPSDSFIIYFTFPSQSGFSYGIP